MVISLKRLLVGSPKRTEQAIHERLSKMTGLAVFASDALSSTAYATEEILLVLGVVAVAGSQGLLVRVIDRLYRYCHLRGVRESGTLFAVVLVVLVITKFVHGAWIVVFLIPILVMMFRAVHQHYEEVAKQLSTQGFEPLRPIRHEVIVPISGIHRGVIRALEYAKSIAPDHVTAVYVDLDEEATKNIREKWKDWATNVDLVVLASPYRALSSPLLRYIDSAEREHKDDMVTVVLPEFVPAKWWQHLLHNQSSLMIKGALLFKKGVIVTSVAYHLEK